MEVQKGPFQEESSLSIGVCAQTHVAMGQNPVTPVNIPIPTKIGSKMGELTYQPKKDPIGFDNHSHASRWEGTSSLCSSLSSRAPRLEANGALQQHLHIAAGVVPPLHGTRHGTRSASGARKRERGPRENAGARVPLKGSARCLLPFEGWLPGKPSLTSAQPETSGK